MRTSLTIDTREWPETWKAAYQLLEQTLVPENLRAWIQPLEFVDTQVSGNSIRIRLAAVNDFSANWVREKHLKALEGAFTQVLGSACEVQILVRDGHAERETYSPPVESAGPVQGAHQDDSGNGPASPGLAGTGVVLTAGHRSQHEGALDVRYTFDSFVVGASNQFAHASAIAVAEQPGKQYNPLFIYSPPGLGKTHLLHAIGNHVLANRPSARVAYLSAEKFVNELIDSLQHRRTSQFRAKYRDSYDLILIDDIQFIAGKSNSEEEFFHTFNALYSSKRQIVLTSDRPPKEIEKLEERIRTRFEWGLVADITPPEIETRIAILKAKAERDDIYVPDEVATFLASYIKSNVRELEGILIKLQAQASLTGAEISLEMAKHELKTAVPEEGTAYTIDSIQNAVLKHFHLKLADLKSESRTRRLALPRQIAMYLARKYTAIGYKEIGRFFGGKDHSTIIHACRKIEGEIETDADVRNAVESIQNLL